MSKRLKMSLIFASPLWGAAVCIWILSHLCSPASVDVFIYKAQWLVVLGLLVAWIESLIYDDKYGF